MMKKARGIALCLFALSLCSCTTMQAETSYLTEQTRASYLPDTFTTKNIMTIHPGMTSDQISKLFGDPISVSQNVCGANHWICITWEYGEFPYDRASFTFNGSSKRPTLNNFDIHRVEESKVLPDTFTTENVMKIHQGISSDKILKTFGFPKDVSQSVCGKGRGIWICTTWEYGNFPYQRASFTFSGNHGSLVLNNFEIKKD